MPTLENPGHYERAEFTAPGYADDFFKWLLADDWSMETGSTECPLGYVVLIKVTGDLISEYVTDQGDPWVSDSRNLSPGWYIVKTDDNGLVWGIGYGGWSIADDFGLDTHAEENARADFAEVELAYRDWLDQSAF